MDINDREHHIKVLEKLLKETNGKIEFYSENKNIDLTKEKEIVETLGYTISSLKTDLKYDLLYEGEEVYTKDDVATILEDLKLDIEAKENYYEQVFKEPSNAIHESAMCGRMFGCGECKELIQQKITRLKEATP